MPKEVTAYNPHKGKSGTVKGSAANKKKGGKKAGGKKKGKGKPVKHKPNTGAARPSTKVSGKTAIALMNKGAAAERAKMKAATNTGKKGKSKPVKHGSKKNGKSSGLIAWLGFKGAKNPSVQQAGAVLRTAGVGFAGAGVSRIISAAFVAFGRRFAPTYITASVVKWAGPLLTALAAVFLSPRALAYFGLKDANSQGLITTGGSIAAVTQLIDNYASTDPVQAIADKITSAIASVNLPGMNNAAANVAQSATQAAVTAGLPPTVANQVGMAAARATLQGQSNRVVSPVVFAERRVLAGLGQRRRVAI